MEELTLEGLVHDLNNVLETVSEAGELLVEDPRWSSLAATLQRSVERGRRLLGSYREQAQASCELRLAVEKAQEFVVDTLVAARAPILEFVREVEPGLRVRGTPTAWERVFLNLFLNAAQVMPKGGAVEIRSRRTDDGLEVTVADAGSGIPVDILGRIFEPRFTTKSARAGLGLHIVKTIVEENGGRVSAANRRDTRGAVFTIRVPSGGAER